MTAPPPPPTRPPPRRQGPRPLPLHLGMAALSCLTSAPAYHLWKSGLLPWKDALAPRAAALDQALAGVDPAQFSAAVDQVGRKRLGRFMSSVALYRAHPPTPRPAEPPVIWRDGSVRLLDYGAGPGAPSAAADGVPLLLIPSLVNRAYVLDLTAERSLARWLAARGVRPLLLDWGAPGDEERGFTLTDYIAGPLESALVAVAWRFRRPVAALGYCMGGLLALAASLRRPELVHRLVVMATPWDFHADRDSARRAAAAAALLGGLIDWLGELPTDWLNALFFGVDPLIGPKKFDAFARMAPGHPSAAAFVALEDWVNDGVALAGPVAKECLAGWYGRNDPGCGRWRVAGRIVDPGRWTQPALALIPAFDRIVPPASAMALAEALPNCQSVRASLGHLGLVSSARAERSAWEPLLRFVLS